MQLSTIFNSIRDKISGVSLGLADAIYQNLSSLASTLLTFLRLRAATTPVNDASPPANPAPESARGSTLAVGMLLYAHNAEFRSAINNIVDRGVHPLTVFQQFPKYVAAQSMLALTKILKRQQSTAEPVINHAAIAVDTTDITATTTPAASAIVATTKHALVPRRHSWGGGFELPEHDFEVIDHADANEPKATVSRRFSCS
jgi:hypothetical protein